MSKSSNEFLETRQKKAGKQALKPAISLSEQLEMDKLDYSICAKNLPVMSLDKLCEMSEATITEAQVYFAAMTEQERLDWNMGFPERQFNVEQWAELMSGSEDFQNEIADRYANVEKFEKLYNKSVIDFNEYNDMSFVEYIAYQDQKRKQFNDDFADLPFPALTADQWSDKIREESIARKQFDLKDSVIRQMDNLFECCGLDEETIEFKQIELIQTVSDFKPDDDEIQQLWELLTKMHIERNENA